MNSLYVQFGQEKNHEASYRTVRELDFYGTTLLKKQYVVQK